MELSTRPGIARGRLVAPPVVGRAQVRAAFDHPARNFDLRLAGVVALLDDRAARTVRPAPVGAEAERPPVTTVRMIHRVPRRRGLPSACAPARPGSPSGQAQSRRPYPGRLPSETRETAVGTVDPEAVHPDAVRRCLLRVMAIGSHAERAALDPDHPLLRMRFGYRHMACHTRSGPCQRDDLGAPTGARGVALGQNGRISRRPRRGSVAAPAASAGRGRIRSPSRAG